MIISLILTITISFSYDSYHQIQLGFQVQGIRRKKVLKKKYTHTHTHTNTYTYTYISIFVYWKKERKWNSRPTLFNPMDCSPPDSSVHGILQARILEQVAILFSRGSSQSRNQTQISHTAGRFFTSWATREAHLFIRLAKKFIWVFLLNIMEKTQTNFDQPNIYIYIYIYIYMLHIYHYNYNIYIYIDR